MRHIKILNSKDLEGDFTNNKTYEVLSDNLLVYNATTDEMEEIETNNSNRLKHRKAARWLQVKDNTDYCCLMQVCRIETRFQFI